ncbi:hypothetical protein [Agrococcus sp. DT81.2]|uniref:hypothetical protein n=1 Tax=Agrococcus sp. DT81.2 TaxID=3393414 RepID=UPI003CE4F08F
MAIEKATRDEAATAVLKAIAEQASQQGPNGLQALATAYAQVMSHAVVEQAGGAPRMGTVR